MPFLVMRKVSAPGFLQQKSVPDVWRTNDLQLMAYPYGFLRFIFEKSISDREQMPYSEIDQRDATRASVIYAVRNCRGTLLTPYALQRMGLTNAEANVTPAFLLATYGTENEAAQAKQPAWAHPYKSEFRTIQINSADHGYVILGLKDLLDYFSEIETNLFSASSKPANILLRAKGEIYNCQRLADVLEMQPR